MNERDETRLRDMQDAARQAVFFVSGKTRLDLEENKQILGFAVVRAIEIVGEAASKITAETRLTLPQVPWGSIIGMRNLIVHEYFSVDYDVVWEVATENLPELLAILASILPDDAQ
jgi:uncharacterized protein with HEPN domain